ncbi:MAG: membrane-bound lytic murein transglycosylase D [Parasphingorhabdus sp.]
MCRSGYFDALIWGGAPTFRHFSNEITGGFQSNFIIINHYLNKYKSINYVENMVIKSAIRHITAILVLAVGFLWSVQSHAVVTVAKHNLACGADFPCPGELRRRTDFWIHVYSKWDSKYGILHDSLYPERVYSVIKTANCGTKQKAVKRERERIKGQLKKVANLVAKGSKPTSKEGKAILALFPEKSAKSIRSAANRIRCQQGNRDRFQNALKRYGAYGKLVNKFIVDAGLPTDIHYLPFVESLYNPRAYSRVGAAGLWQIMPRTARVLGLELNATVDERLDLEAASIGAARYLKDARNRLTKVARGIKPDVSDGELTPFVITSYNYGVNGMRRALQKYGPDFITVLNNHKTPSFQVAVKNFYSSFLAARHVAKNAEKYFGKVKPDAPLKYNTVVLKRDTSMQRIMRIFSLSEEQIKPLNRALTRFVWHGWRLVPKGYRLRLPYRGDRWGTHAAALRSLPAEDDSRRPAKYIVRKGDTACGIARAFRVKCKDVVDMNRLGQRAFIRVGQTLVIPGKNKANSPRKNNGKNIGLGGVHLVQRGEVPCGIASSYAVKCIDLMNLNGLTKKSIIYIGQNLKIPGGTTPKSSGSTQKKNDQSSYNSDAYIVKHGDTACEIADRVGVACKKFLHTNNLTSRSVLQVGQSLKVTSLSNTDPNVIENSTASDFKSGFSIYKVRPGDTPCQIARKVNMDCPAFQRVNNLRTHSVIYVGQVLKVPPTLAETQAKSTSKTIKTPAEISPSDSDSIGAAATSPLDNQIDLDVRVIQVTSGFQHSISVEADETLGHYADWLGIGSSSAIRTLNKLPLDTLLEVGKKLKLPVSTDQQLAKFQKQRQDYHRVLVEEFKEHYQIMNIESYIVKSGDSPWRIADKFQLPFWVITRYNPDLRKRGPSPGEVLKIPQVRPRGA